MVYRCALVPKEGEAPPVPADRIYFSHRMCRGDPNWRICEYRPAPCTAFPNVFHPDFEAACDWWARQRCAPYRANQVPVTDLYRAAHDTAKRPLFLTEWSFPALDAGMPCTHGAGQRFRTQGERVQASELYARDEATGIVTATIRAEGEGRADGSRRAPAGAQPGSSSAEGDPRFAFTHRLSLAPGRADILAEIVSLENTGATPFLVKVLFMRPFAIQAEPGETETVPNLWKGPSEGYWALDDGLRWGVSSRDAGFLKARLWYREEDRSQHPDVRCMEGKPFVLAPGATFRPTLPMGALVRFLPPESYGSSQ